MQKIVTMKEPAIPSKGYRKLFAFVKRAFDIVSSSLVILLLSPLYLIVGIIAAIDTKSTPLFIQERIGRHGRPFRVIKFRTMSKAAPADVPTYELNGAENYISRVGSTLRRFSLDELPQFFNIFIGDMSFIGPRPVVPSETELLELRARNGASEIRPGLTGWAQVNGRDTVTLVEKAKLDGYYVSHMSVRMDFRVLFKTVGYVLHSTCVCEGVNETIAPSKAMRRERSA